MFDPVTLSRLARMRQSELLERASRGKTIEQLDEMACIVRERTDGPIGKWIGQLGDSILNLGRKLVHTATAAQSARYIPTTDITTPDSALDGNVPETMSVPSV